MSMFFFYPVRWRWWLLFYQTLYDLAEIVTIVRAKPKALFRPFPTHALLDPPQTSIIALSITTVEIAKSARILINLYRLYGPYI